MGGNKTPFIKDFLKGADAIEWARIGAWGKDQIGGIFGGSSEIF